MYLANSKQELPISNWTTGKINIKQNKTKCIRTYILAELDHIPQRKSNSTRSPIRHMLNSIHNPNTNNNHEDDDILSATVQIRRAGSSCFQNVCGGVKWELIYSEQLRTESCARKIEK